MDDHQGFFLDEFDPDINILPELTCKYHSDLSLKHLSPQISRNFSIFHINIRSIAKNGQTLTHYLYDLNFSVIALTETWLTANTVSLYDLPKYNHISIHRNDRRGGGVSLHLAEFLSYKERDDLSVISEACEMLFVEVKFGTSNYIIGAVYRPPSACQSDFLTQLTQTLTMIGTTQKCYLLGDFNIDISLQQPIVQNFLDILHSFSFLSLIDKPTRVTHETASLIDNIFTNRHTQSHIAGVLVADISDHYPVFCVSDSSISDQPPQTITYRPLTTNSKQAFLEAISAINWEFVTDESDAQSAYSAFAQRLVSCFSSCFPLKHRTANRSDANPWLTRGVKKSIRVKNKLYRKFRNRPNTHTEIHYKRYRSILDRVIRSAKQIFYQQCLEVNRNDKRKTWQILKEVIGKSRTKPCLKSALVGEEVCTDPRRISDELNNYFANVGVNFGRSIPTASRDPMSYLTGNYPNSIFLTPVTPLEVSACLMRLKNSSAGHDSLLPSIMKMVSDFISKPLVYIINLCITQSIFPSELQQANIIPIHKGGDPTLFPNYRPISVLPVFSKIFERLLYTRLYKFFSDQHIIIDTQFGFRKGFSTEQALAYTFERITLELDRGNCVVGLFLDLKKAFDTVHHEILLQKLYHYGIRGGTHTLLKSYLANRTQVVLLNNHKSSLQSCHFGVPQGSILGPLFFLVYINDLVNSLSHTYPILYADDTNIFISGNNLNCMTNRFNADLESLSEWLKTNRLSLNLSKTHSMIFSTNRFLRSQILSLQLSGTIIDTVKSTTFLGIKIDNALTWSEHVNHVCNKISKSIGILKKVSSILNYESLLVLYRSLITPYLQYCTIIWGNAASVHLQRVLLLQKRAVRIVNGLGYRDHTASFFARDGILRISDLYTLACSVFLYKVKNTLFPIFFAEFFNRVLFGNNTVHELDTRTRAQGLVRPFRCRTSLRQKTFSNVSIRIMNSMIIPYDLFLTSPSLKVFKRSITSLLIATY